MGSRCVKFGVIALTLSYWSLEVQHGKELSEDLKKIIVALHKDGVGQGKATLVLEGRCPAEFSSNPNQTHLNVFKITRKLQAGVFD